MKLKKEFQISLWEDFMDNETIEGISFINERKICDIASDSLKNPRAAYNVVFKSKTDGTHELTFDINYRYWDQDEQDFIENPIRKYLYNEAKVKLHYKNRWYDFLIKNCQENSKEKKFTYTCKDLFIDELGRNGYSAEFSTELGNNVGSPTELAAAALEGSDWTVAPNRLEVEEVIEGEEYSDVPLQRNSEPVYAYTFSEGTIKYKEINEDGSVSDAEFDGEITAASTDAKTIFICYGSANDSTCEGIDYQFYYNESGYYDTDDDSNFINTRPKYLVSLSDDFSTEGKLRLQFTEANHVFQHNYRGYRYIRAQKTAWLDKIKRRVTLYDRDGQEYYGYEKTSYLSPAIAQNVLINSGPVFNGTSGWRAFTEVNKNGEIKTVECNIELGGEYGMDEDNVTITLGGDTYLKSYYYEDGVKKYPTGQVEFRNLAFKNNLKNIGALTEDEIWVIRIKDNIGTLEIYDTINEEKIPVFERVESFLPIVPNDGYNYYFYKVIKSYSYKQLSDNPIVFSFTPLTIIGENEQEVTKYNTLYGLNFFRCYTIDNNLIVPESDITSQNLIKNEYYYFTQEQYEACRGEEDLQLDFMEDTEPDKESYVYYENFQKVATIEEKESNYFNIIQTINEKFECWADFQISHEPSGAISVDDTGKRIKRVVFKNYIGKDNWAGFKYGINLDNIQRTINSEEITTKTIVKSNSNEFAKYGSCNIARAKGNPTKSQFIIDFNYFINQGVLKEFEVNNDLYLEDNGYLGYYTKLNRYNDALLVLEDKLIALENAIQKADVTIQASNVGEEDFMEEITSIQEKLAEDIIGFSGEGNTFQKKSGSTIFRINETPNNNGFFEWIYDDSVTFYRLTDESNPNSESSYSPYPPGTTVIYNLNKGRELVDNYNRFINDRYLATNNKRKLEEDKARLIAQRDGEYSYVDVDGNPRIIRYKNGKWYKVLLEPIIEEIVEEKIKINPELETDITIVTETTNSEDYIWNLNKLIGGVIYDEVMERLHLEKTLVESDLSPELSINPDFQPLLPSIKKLDSQFYSKYSRFIREGTWISEDYTDDDLYYYDACSVAYTSAFPKTTYSISVVDIKSSIIPDELGYDFSNYDFNCGDLTTMEDVEFFGWKDSEKKTPYREMVLISETEEHLDSPAANKITVQNYKTQFDDLFQRITATTQSLELKQGQYDRASEVVNVNGEINKTFLQNTLYNNSLILKNSGAQGVEWGDKGIITTDLIDPSYMTRIVGGGIVISEDGGATWSTGISGKGINASMIRTGQLDVGKVHIMNGNDISFTWNEYGISGFDKNLAGGYDYSKYTRMDRFGFYAVDGTVDYIPTSDDDIWNNINVPYCLIKKGFRLGSSSGNQIIMTKVEGQWKLTIDGSLNVSDGSTIAGWNITETQITQVFGKKIDNGIYNTRVSLKMPSIDTETSEFIPTSAAFYVTNSDEENALFRVNWDGSMKASYGEIAGWEINFNALRTQNSDNTRAFRISSASDSSSNDWLVARKTITNDNNENEDTIPFRVTKDGKLYATGVEIDGKINATSGNFSDAVTIGGTTLTASTLRNFYYNASGGSGTQVKKINANNGDIGGWTIGDTSLKKGTIGNDGSIHLYTSYSGNSIGIAGVSSDKWRLTVGSNFGVTNDGTIAASNLIVSGGQIGDSSYGETAIWKFGTETFTYQSYGAMIGKPNYQGVTQTVLLPVAAMYYWSDGNTTTSFDATWAQIISGAKGSDRRLKKDIQDINLKYEKMFDNLLPKQYKYKEGKRDHLGFIAQEIEENIKNVGMTALDFAGLVKWDLNNDYSGNYALRYEEFIALNTWQIQKLKTRVTDLETEISNLKLQLKNLQNS